MNVLNILRVSPVIPVVTIHDVAHAVPLAGALAEGGVGIIEVTLRTPAALDAMRLIRKALPDVIVGAGTIWDADALKAAIDTGAHFGVSPGVTPKLVDAIVAADWPFLPGGQTPGEIAFLRESGFTAAKFFPAATAGGPAALKALASVFADLTFCPTGGINAATAMEYRAIANVPTVGGSWLTPKGLVEAGDWTAISRLAAAAVDH